MMRTLPLILKILVPIFVPALFSGCDEAMKSSASLIRLLRGSFSDQNVFTGSS